MTTHSVSQTKADASVADIAQADFAELMREATVDVETTGRLLKLSRNTTYKALRNGEIPSVRVGAQYRVPTAKLRAMLGVSTPEPVAA